MKWFVLLMVFTIFITQNAADERLPPLNITRLVVQGIKEAAEDTVAVISHRISNALVDLIKEVQEVLPEEANSTFKLLKGLKETTTVLQTSILHDLRIVLYRFQQQLTEASAIKMPHPMMPPPDWDQGVRAHDAPLSTDLKADFDKVNGVLTGFDNFVELLTAPFLHPPGLKAIEVNITVPINLSKTLNATIALNETTKIVEAAGKLHETSKPVEDLTKVVGTVGKDLNASKAAGNLMKIAGKELEN